jgi:hypothetical protein
MHTSTLETLLSSFSSVHGVEMGRRNFNVLDWIWRLLSEVKHDLDRLVLRWGTTLESKCTISQSSGWN